MNHAYNELVNQMKVWFDDKFAALEGDCDLRERSKGLSAELAK